VRWSGCIRRANRLPFDTRFIVLNGPNIRRVVEDDSTSSQSSSNSIGPELFQKAAKQAHLGVAQPEDLAAIAVFLAGPRGSKITGQAISVNGGISAA
jgi:NAD(P)-dependent dehydrogenase (short-subunit alcohol dehydrogenase family)